ncbi:ribonuclease R [Nitratidesulfovibrio liaohensis]|uniref:Ribonuclease R n=1 Tax=Nitratidesulfovibrio liaohensis TaxID=2604158 RepID=A0ABY9R5X2_9BACT|nr:ribonuclease R [Nitratidesulfovibrio liaohensis]WMW66537.1 ribonuclease R [Nitratidesulfovibrio liaohensis]
MTKKKREESYVLPDANDLATLFREAHRPLKIDALMRMLGLHRRMKKELEDRLDDLVRQGRIIRLRGGAWGLVEQLRLVTGTLSIQRSGMGFVLLEEKGRDDIYVHPYQMGDAWHGDKVVVALLPGRHGKNPEGRIVRVLERGRKEIPARVVRRMGRHSLLCRAADPRMAVSFVVDMSAVEEKAEKGDLVVAAPGEKVEDGLWAATGLAVLGADDNVLVQERLVKINHDVPTDFPPEVLEEARDLPAVPSRDDMEGRIDLRHLEFVTIDGAKARDFDDAVYVEEQGTGYRLWVAIADVAHYVRPGSAMDREAQGRSNSYYFPQSVEPMLPEALSNGLCSLNPRVPRLAMVAETFFYADGTPGRSKFYAAIIESKARLTYGQVNRAIIEKDEKERRLLTPVLPLLERAEALARLLNAKRSERGSLDFDLPEPEVIFNIYGETVDIGRKVRHFGHQIIEEFMIAANEAVARFLTEKNARFLYRVHPEPDTEKLEGLFKVLARTSLAQHLPGKASAKALQGVLQAAKGTDQEFVVNRMALRTMMQARYAPDHEGHFGLASECYCHFTSPIRRYADLIVHRALRRTLGLPVNGPLPGERALLTIADTLNVNERVAMEAEREILKRITVLFLSERVGEEFTGVISGIIDFGFFVEFNEVMAEGMVRLSSLDDDYYGYLPERQELVGERTGRSFRLGQAVTVRLADVNVTRLEVNLALAGPDAVASTGVRKERRDHAGRSGRDARGGRGARPGERSGERSGRSEGRDVRTGLRQADSVAAAPAGAGAMDERAARKARARAATDPGLDDPMPMPIPEPLENAPRRGRKTSQHGKGRAAAAPASERMDGAAKKVGSVFGQAPAKPDSANRGKDGDAKAEDAWGQGALPGEIRRQGTRWRRGKGTSQVPRHLPNKVQGQRRGGHPREGRRRCSQAWCGFRQARTGHGDRRPGCQEGECWKYAPPVRECWQGWNGEVWPGQARCGQVGQGQGLRQRFCKGRAARKRQARVRQGRTCES